LSWRRSAASPPMGHGWVERPCEIGPAIVGSCEARGLVAWPVCPSWGGAGLFFADCESGSGAFLDAQGISGGSGLPHGVGVWFGAVRVSVAVPAWVSDPVRVVVPARGLMACPSVGAAAVFRDVLCVC